jgi:sugar-specific transcriptional regulator TrmB
MEYGVQRMTNKLVTSGRWKEGILWDLITHGPSTAGQISARIGLHKNKVYDFLADLQTEEFVEKHPKIHKDTIYAIDKRKVLHVLENRKRDLQEELIELAQAVDKVKLSDQKMVAQLSGEIWTGKAEDALSQTLTLFSEAKKTIRVSTYVFSWFREAKDVLLSKLKDGLDVQILMTAPSSPSLLSQSHRATIQELAEFLIHNKAKVYYTQGRLPFRGSIVDDRICVIMMFPYSMADKETSTGYFICNNKAVVRLLSNYWDVYCGKN